MSQRERDRLKILHEVSKRQITQKQAAEHLKLSERQVRRLVTSLKQLGDVAVVHGLRGRASNRKTSGDLERRAIEELRREECRDFGPTFAAEHVSKVLGIKVGRDTIRKWLIAAGLWQSRKRKVETIHQWRERRACFGELVQWDTCIHDWLEGRGERLYLIAMIDDATSRVHARFVRHDTAEENMRVLWQWLERYGRPLAFYTDKAAMFETTPKSSHASEQGDAADADHSCFDGVGDRAHFGSQSAGQGTDREIFQHSPGPAGEAVAPGRRVHVGGSERLPRDTVPA